MQSSSWRFVIPGLASLLLFGVSIQAMALNPIQIENAIPPVAADYAWNAANFPNNPHNIEGYADQTSVNLGNTIKFYVNANSALNQNYTLTIYRLGYYSGAGARRMAAPVTLPSVTQTLPMPDPVTGLIECNWSNPYTFTVPTTWTSGIYIAALVGTTTGEGSYIPFVVKQNSSTAAYVFQTSDTSWQAYNGWGGKSLYSYNSSNSVPAVKVSYNRPYDIGTGLGAFVNWELQTIRFLEKHGYDVTYQSDIDTHTGGQAQLTKHKAYLSAGHDEYWSKAMRDNVENAKLQGLSLGFLGANAAYWQIRLENSLVTGVGNRTIVAYKEAARTQDPFALDSNIPNNVTITTLWRDTTYYNRPENALIGIMYTYDPVNADIVVANAAHWAFTGTGLQNGSTLPGLLGYEVDAYVSNGKAPAGVEILAHSPANLSKGIYSDMSVYTQACSLAPCISPTATVFGTGSMQWAWGLDSFGRTVNLENAAAQQVTHNLLARMVNPSAVLPAIPPNNNNNIPTFVGGSTSLNIVKSSPATDLKPNMHVSDPDLGQTLTWSQRTAPSHGTLIISGASASAGGNDITPGGVIAYQPIAGYNGPDSFTVQVSDGFTTSTRSFSVNVTTSSVGNNLVTNPSLELDLDVNSEPDCWQFGGYGTNTPTWTRTTDAHTGSFAQQLQITSFTNGDRKMLSTLDVGQSAGGCAVAVQAGIDYQLSTYYKATLGTRIVIYALNAGVWDYWKSSAIIPAANAWAQATVKTGPIPAGVQAISFGLSLEGAGVLITDDYAITQVLTANTAPSFVGGATALSVTQNSSAVDLKPNLHVSDIDSGQTLAWSQATAPSHGTLVISGANANSGNADISPSGTISYKPAPGYSGTDSFSIQISDGFISATRTFSVTVTASGLGANLLVNPSLELDVDANSLPDCWQYSGYGANTSIWTRSTDAHSGSFAQQLQITSYTNGDRKMLPVLDAGQNAGGCAPSVQAGANYQLSVYYKSTVNTRFILFYLDAAGVWQYWASGTSLPAASTWTPAIYTTSTLPSGAQAVAFGLALEGVGTLTTDDYSLRQML